MASFQWTWPIFLAALTPALGLKIAFEAVPASTTLTTFTSTYAETVTSTITSLVPVTTVQTQCTASTVFNAIQCSNGVWSSAGNYWSEWCTTSSLEGPVFATLVEANVYACFAACSVYDIHYNRRGGLYNDHYLYDHDCCKYFFDSACSDDLIFCCSELSRRNYTQFGSKLVCANCFYSSCFVQPYRLESNWVIQSHRFIKPDCQVSDTNWAVANFLAFTLQKRFNANLVRVTFTIHHFIFHNTGFSIWTHTFHPRSFLFFSGFFWHFISHTSFPFLIFYTRYVDP
ncbi:hypothetical protein N7493_002698 [Penicillium malachiteum]|uniref:Uncharacterized protein n=1 Tax=Penicillium malachiteum TaxID=1324776 RepID=A0AAD6HSB6_9EURO|nr:hypothetical protein N7493_002698 [Penicillium malachiteum]